MEVKARGSVVSRSIEAKIIRANGDVEDLGCIAYWHRNPLKRWAWQLKQKRKKGRKY